MPPPNRGYYVSVSSVQIHPCPIEKTNRADLLITLSIQLLGYLEMKTLKLSMISAAVIAAMGMSSAFAAAEDVATVLNNSTVSVASSTTVVKKCTTLTGGTINFTAYVPDAIADNDSQGTISVRCTKGTPVTISMDAGQGSGATEAIRKLTSANDKLNYSIYTDSSRSDLWGSGTDKVSTFGDGLLSTTTLDVYGRIIAGQDVKPGSFSDTVTVTLGY